VIGAEPVWRIDVQMLCHRASLIVLDADTPEVLPDAPESATRQPELSSNGHLWSERQD